MPRTAKPLSDFTDSDSPSGSFHGMPGESVTARLRRVWYVRIEGSQPFSHVPSGDLRVDLLGRRVLDGERRLGALAHGGETVVRVVEMALLGVEIRVRHDPPFSESSCGRANTPHPRKTMGGAVRCARSRVRTLSTA